MDVKASFYMSIDHHAEPTSSAHGLAVALPVEHHAGLRWRVDHPENDVASNASLPAEHNSRTVLLGSHLEAEERSNASRDAAAASDEERQSEVLRTLAVGLAHHLNNSLQSIVSYADLLTRGGPVSSRRNDASQAISGSADRVQRLVKDLVACTNDGPVPLVISDVSRWLGDWGERIREQCGADTTLDIAAAPAPIWVQAQPLLAQQAFLHLVSNAVEALPSKSNRISVRAGSAWFGREQLQHARPRRHGVPGVYAYLEVRDEGPGIAPVDLPRVFDPLFSTKFLGRGFGLPLAVALMRRMGGLVRIASNRNGTRASLLFATAKPGVRRA